MKSIEFGAKCNNLLVDGLSFIEKLSFNAFNEGTGLPCCLKMHRRLFGVDARKVSGNAGYAGNTNREYCRKRDTDIIREARPSFLREER
ncbi:MAG: hypothetical protein MR292_06975 [Alistipes sp.]|nr:hypothetical protein [Alistipes sp.]